MEGRVVPDLELFLLIWYRSYRCFVSSHSGDCRVNIHRCWKEFFCLINSWRLANRIHRFFRRRYQTKPCQSDLDIHWSTPCFHANFYVVALSKNTDLGDTGDSCVGLADKSSLNNFQIVSTGAWYIQKEEEKGLGIKNERSRTEGRAAQLWCCW